MSSDEAELVAVYGRRRVGKTFLVRKALGPDICFELTGVHDAPLGEQLRNFANALSRAHKRRSTQEAPKHWQSAMQDLIVWLESLPKRKRKRVIFFDELPWLASRRSEFLRAFEHFWNSWGSRKSTLVVVVCGSAASWMINRLLRARGGLHNRVTRRIRLEPFSVKEAKAMLASRDIALKNYQVAELYMAMGGIPHYLKEVSRGASASQNIDRVCFTRDGLLRDEFSNLYASLFEHSERHEAVVRALARVRKGMNRTELIQKAGLKSGGTTTSILKELGESGFVSRALMFGYQTKEAIYYLTDEYSLFYLKWIERHVGHGKNRWSTRRGTPAWRAWSGLAFESICRKHINELKAALGIGAVETIESTWRHVSTGEGDSGAQVDLLIDRKDGCINVCEMKFCDAEFRIDRRYAEELRNKLATFRRVTETKKTLFLTMVTTHGIHQNQYRDELVDADVNLDALFC